MLIVLQVTGRCDFSCTMCSATSLKRFSDMSLDTVDKVLSKYKSLVDSICIVGGEPLLRGPKFFQQLISLVETKYPKISRIDITSNMWQFKKRPEDWTEIFKHKKVYPCTSFQYGDARRLSKSRIFTESDFLEIFSLYKSLIGEPLSFIAVLDEANEHRALDTVKLAKSLNTQCMLSVKQGYGAAKDRWYPFAKGLKIYADIITSGLAYYEDNSSNLLDLVSHSLVGGICPFNRHCRETILTVDPNGNEACCTIESRETSTKIYFAKLKDQTDSAQNYISDKCFTCSMFKYCNGCYQHIKGTRFLYKTEEELVQNHCRIVHESIQRVIDYAKNHSN